MGRPRKPTKLKILEGNPGRRPLNKSEPEYAPTVAKPSDLTPTASEWWDLVVPQLVRLGLAQSVDQPSLVLLAEDYAGWDRASRLYMSQPPLVMRGLIESPGTRRPGRTNLRRRRRRTKAANRATSNPGQQSVAACRQRLRSRVPAGCAGVWSDRAIPGHPLGPGA